MNATHPPQIYRWIIKSCTCLICCCCRWFELYVPFSCVCVCFVADSFHPWMCILDRLRTQLLYTRTRMFVIQRILFFSIEDSFDYHLNIFSVHLFYISTVEEFKWDNKLREWLRNRIKSNEYMEFIINGGVLICLLPSLRYSLELCQ